MPETPHEPQATLYFHTTLDFRRKASPAFQMLKHLRQGGKLVTRDENGQVIRAVKLPNIAAPIEHWRKFMARYTDNGRTLLEHLHELAMGVPQIHTLPDGRVSDPVIPTPEVQRAASKDLFEFMHGKAVAQTEIAAAEKQDEVRAQLRALSDADLDKMLANTVDGEYKKLP